MFAHAAQTEVVGYALLAICAAASSIVGFLAGMSLASSRNEG